MANGRCGIQGRIARCWGLLRTLQIAASCRYRRTHDLYVIESKVGEERFLSSDERQVEEYCLDLRDFHEGSRAQNLFPVLWATHAASQEFRNPAVTDFVAPVSRVGATGLAGLIAAIGDPSKPTIDAGEWDTSGYHPVLANYSSV